MGYEVTDREHAQLRTMIGQLRLELRRHTTTQLRATVAALVVDAGVELITATGPDANDFWNIVEVDGGDSLIVQQWDNSASAFLERLEIVGKGTGVTDEGDMVWYANNGDEVMRWDDSANVYVFKRDTIFDDPWGIHVTTYASRNGPDAGDEWKLETIDGGDAWVISQFDASASADLERIKIIGKGTTITDEGDMILSDLDGVETVRFDESDSRWEYAARPFSTADSQLLEVEGHTHAGSALTTKGDVHGFTIDDARVPVGTNGQVLTADSTQGLGLKWATPSGGGGGGSSHFEYVEIGTLTTKTGTLRWYPPFDITLTDVTINVPTQPTGASILVDVNKNGTTVFTTQSNRPTIAVSTNFDKSGTPNITALSKDSDYITVDIDQVGSTVPGADMTIQIRYDVV